MANQHQEIYWRYSGRGSWGDRWGAGGQRQQRLVSKWACECVECQLTHTILARFLVDNGNTVEESYIVSDHCPPICFNHDEEAAKALQQAEIIAQRYVPYQEPSLPKSKFTNHHIYQVVQMNMYMYCIDIPVSTIPYIWSLVWSIFRWD